MEELFWIVACIALVVVAMAFGGRGKRHRRPRWTSSSELDPVILGGNDVHHHHGHHDGGGHHGGFDGGGHGGHH
jgi:hypothetical protein